MGFFSKTLSVLFGVALLGVLGVGGYFALICIVERLRSMDFQVAAVTTSASVVILLAALIIAKSIRQASQQHQAPQLRAEQAATYQRCTDLWGHLLRHGHGAEARSPHGLSDELLDLERLLLLYGSPGVLKAYAALRALERESGAHHPHVRAQFATLLLEMRQDLGSETTGLTAAALLPLLFAEAAQASTPVPAPAYQDLQPRVSLVASS